MLLTFPLFAFNYLWVATSVAIQQKLSKLLIFFSANIIFLLHWHSNTIYIPAQRNGDMAGIFKLANPHFQRALNHASLHSEGIWRLRIWLEERKNEKKKWKAKNNYVFQWNTKKKNGDSSNNAYLSVSCWGNCVATVTVSNYFFAKHHSHYWQLKDCYLVWMKISELITLKISECKALWTVHSSDTCSSLLLQGNAQSKVRFLVFSCSKIRTRSEELNLPFYT